VRVLPHQVPVLETFWVEGLSQEFWWLDSWRLAIKHGLREVRDEENQIVYQDYFVGRVGGEPLTDLILRKSDMREFLADIIVIAVILLFCFAIGLMMKTAVARWVFNWLERRVLKIAPGYNMIKETINQFLGRKKSPFSSVALVRIFENRTMATAFVTDEHPDGSYTVFVPTGPNPTSGQIFHLQKEFVHPVDVGVDETMRSILSCGAGSTPLIQSHSKTTATRS
jgi:uncharacterized membrane protein